jgi:hypothetical protein
MGGLLEGWLETPKDRVDGCVIGEFATIIESKKRRKIKNLLLDIGAYLVSGGRSDEDDGRDWELVLAALQEGLRFDGECLAIYLENSACYDDPVYADKVKERFRVLREYVVPDAHKQLSCAISRLRSHWSTCSDDDGTQDSERVAMENFLGHVLGGEYPSGYDCRGCDSCVVPMEEIKDEETKEHLSVPVLGMRKYWEESKSGYDEEDAEALQQAVDELLGATDLDATWTKITQEKRHADGFVLALVKESIYVAIDKRRPDLLNYALDPLRPRVCIDVSLISEWLSDWGQTYLTNKPAATAQERGMPSVFKILYNAVEDKHRYLIDEVIQYYQRQPDGNTSPGFIDDRVAHFFTGLLNGARSKEM